MTYSRSTVGRMQLDDYVRVVPQVYGSHDANRSIWDVWCHTLHHGAAVAERIRKKAPSDKLFTEIADFALWLFTTVQKLSGKPGRRKAPLETDTEILIRIQSTCSDLIWHRYPRVCHLCYARRKKSAPGLNRGHGLVSPCDCALQPQDYRDKKSKRLDSKDLLKFSESRQNLKPVTINDWQIMFADIFRANIAQIPTSEIGFHLLEELGEVSDALVRMYSFSKKDFRSGEPNWRQARLEGQIADVFSWLFALVEKLSEVRPVTLAEIIWLRYGSDRLGSFRCPACGQPVCSCQLMFIGTTRPIGDWLKKYRQPRQKRGVKQKLKHMARTK